MSRCFPFPPPGYEKKARSDDADLPNKEKQREKKPKKEKKDKEKREDKEKSEKDRNGKNRDKKDRKEKHREKKKEKEKDKDKGKNTPSEETRIADQGESYNGEKLNQNEKLRDKDKNGISHGKAQTLQLQGQSGFKPIQNSHMAEATRDSKFVQELCRRIRDEEKGAGSQLVDRLPATQKKIDERDRVVVVKDTRILAGGKEKNNEKRVDTRKIDGQEFKGDARSSGSAVVQNLVGMVNHRVEGMPRPLAKNIEKQMEERKKSKEREGDDKRGEKRKDKDEEKKGHGKDKEREKEKKKEAKAREKIENKAKDQDKIKDSNENDQLGTSNVRTSHVAKDGDKNTATDGILKKRKDLEANGFLHDSDVKPNKMPRLSSHPLPNKMPRLSPHPSPNTMPRPSPHPSTENGRKLEPCQTSILFTTDMKGPPDKLKLNNKERKVNGVMEAHPLPISSKKSSSASTHADQIAQASTKPPQPHPDSKYLSQVLSVPKMEEWSDFDDQEWLFSSKDRSAEKKPNVVGSPRAAETPRVWAEALQLESADVCALPYVIPY